jgi:hypothetical protein
VFYPLEEYSIEIREEKAETLYKNKDEKNN